MKPLTPQNRRSNIFRSAPEAAGDAAVKPPAAILWVILHALFCLISLLLGFRFSRLLFFLLFAASSPPSKTTYSLPSPALPERNTSAAAGGGASRVVVGRHGILIRPWPHPDPTEVMKAHRIIERVQAEQRAQYGVKNPRTVIAITPTYVRTFQTLHLTGVMNSLMNVPYDLIWIVVEAPRTTNETSELIAKSGLKTIHLNFDQKKKMPVLWEDRHKLESRMRLHALRIVREKRLDGIVVFADDSNMHSLDLFDEIQNVKWVGAVSVGILAGGSEQTKLLQQDDDRGKDGKKPQVPIQGPACNSSNHLVGWHVFDTLPFVKTSARYIGDSAVVLPRKMEWAGFVLNSRLVWREMEERPVWVKEWEEFDRDEEDIESPLSLLKDTSVVEPLGTCGRRVLLWWLRVEARADSKFPARWIIDPPLKITVPAKRTPSELPSSPSEKVILLPENRENKRSAKSGSRRKRSSRNKRKRASTKVSDERVSLARHVGDGIH